MYRKDWSVPLIGAWGEHVWEMTNLFGKSRQQAVSCEGVAYHSSYWLQDVWEGTRWRCRVEISCSFKRIFKQCWRTPARPLCFFLNICKAFAFNWLKAKGSWQRINELRTMTWVALLSSCQSSLLQEGKQEPQYFLIVYSLWETSALVPILWDLLVNWIC